MKTVILVVMTFVYGGSNIQFQEFNSLEQCNYVREIVGKRGNVQEVYCFYK